MQWEFPGQTVVDSTLPLEGVWVRSLVKEIRSCMPQGMAKETDQENTKQNKKQDKKKNKTKTLCNGGVVVTF